MLKFEAPDQTTTVGLYDAPTKTDHTDEEWAEVLADWELKQHVKIEVRQVDPETREKWSYSWMRMDAEEARRLAEIRASVNDPESIVHKPGYVTEEGRKDRRELGNEVMDGCLAKVSGFMVGNVDVGSIQDVPELKKILDHVDLLDLATARAIGAMKPNRVESKS